MKGNSHNMLKMTAKRRKSKLQIKTEKADTIRKESEITTKLAQIEAMQAHIIKQDAHIQQKEIDNAGFLDLFHQGMLTTNEQGVMSVVTKKADQQRIAAGFEASARGDHSTKTKEQIDFESFQGNQRSSLEGEMNS